LRVLKAALEKAFGRERGMILETVPLDDQVLAAIF